MAGQAAGAYRLGAAGVVLGARPVDSPAGGATFSAVGSELCCGVCSSCPGAHECVNAPVIPSVDSPAPTIVVRSGTATPTARYAHADAGRARTNSVASGTGRVVAGYLSARTGWAAVPCAVVASITIGGW